MQKVNVFVPQGVRGVRHFSVGTASLVCYVVETFCRSFQHATVLNGPCFCVQQCSVRNILTVSVIPFFLFYVFCLSVKIERCSILSSGFGVKLRIKYCEEFAKGIDFSWLTKSIVFNEMFDMCMCIMFIRECLCKGKSFVPVSCGVLCFEFLLSFHVFKSKDPVSEFSRRKYNQKILGLITVPYLGPRRSDVCRRFRGFKISNPLKVKNRLLL